MAEDADMRNELEEMQRRADQLADEVRGAKDRELSYSGSGGERTSSNVSIRKRVGQWVSGGGGEVRL